TDGLSTFEGEPQEFKIAHLRNLYQKVGKFGVPGQGSLGDQVRGFGVLHDGSISTVFDFVSSPVFQNLNTTEKQQLEQFLLAFDTGLAPAVGQQVSIDANTFNLTAFVNRINLLVAQANAGACDLVVKGNTVAQGSNPAEERGAVYVGNNNFQRDRNADGLLTTTQVRNLAAIAGEEGTFTCVTPGSGLRIGADRDLDGVFDRQEMDCNTDPADPQSFPPTSGPCTLGTTTTSTTTSTTTTTHAGSTSTSSSSTTTT